MASIRGNPVFHPRRRFDSPGQGSAVDCRATRSLLLIGTPGTGKRPVAHYLAGTDEFVHVDFEDEGTRAFYLDGSTAALRRHLKDAAGARRLVITWAAGGPEQLGQIRRLRSLGVEPVWFDSDRGAAFHAHFAGARRTPSFEFVDPFEPDGQFRAVESVVADLLEPRLRRRPGAELVAAARGRVALAGAALAGVAAASVVVLAGIEAFADRQPVALHPLAPAARAATHRAPALPQRGILVSGKSLAGVQLGDTMPEVKALWGGRFTRCDTCKPAMWFYWYPPPADPQGAGVQFANGRVVAVFTLGSPAGWRTETGIHVGQILDNPTGAGESHWLTCAGYSANSTRTTANAVTSILTQGAAVYGFALTRPSVSPCH
ncbi:MAG TPA: hypothetical protein VH063_03340 [Gaiellaceae bacterium]|jgi:hypothetical protein|nr:hypothetical protein [Gaiellaceae bacterium]